MKEVLGESDIDLKLCKPEESDINNIMLLSEPPAPVITI